MQDVGLIQLTRKLSNRNGGVHTTSGCGLEHFLFSHILGIIIPIDEYFSEGVKPPTRLGWVHCASQYVWSSRLFKSPEIRADTHRYLGHFRFEGDSPGRYCMHVIYMYIYIYTHIHIYMCIHKYVFIYINMHLRNIHIVSVCRCILLV